MYFALFVKEWDLLAVLAFFQFFNFKLNEPVITSVKECFLSSKHYSWVKNVKTQHHLFMHPTLQFTFVFVFLVDNTDC